MAETRSGSGRNDRRPGARKRIRPTMLHGSLITLLILTLVMIYMSGGR